MVKLYNRLLILVIIWSLKVSHRYIILVFLINLILYIQVILNLTAHLYIVFEDRILIDILSYFQFLLFNFLKIVDKILTSIHYIRWWARSKDFLCFTGISFTYIWIWIDGSNIILVHHLESMMTTIMCKLELIYNIRTKVLI